MSVHYRAAHSLRPNTKNVQPRSIYSVVRNYGEKYSGVTLFHHMAARSKEIVHDQKRRVPSELVPTLL